MLHPAVSVIVMGTLIVSFGLVAYRTLRGPTSADRVLGVDMLAYVAIGLIATLALTTGHVVMIDVAVVLALVAFIGTVAFAHFGLRDGGSS